MEETRASPVRLFDSFGIAPRVVRFFLLEKQIELPRYEIDLLLGENRDEEFLKLNPTGQTPALELSDGIILCEATAICEYLEEASPTPPLIGATACERAIARMWWRRVELTICQPMIMGFYFGEGLEMFRTRTRCIPEAADGMKDRARDGMRSLDAMLGNAWVAGERFTVADLHLYCFLDDLAGKGQKMPEDCIRLKAWFDRVATRPAADMSGWRWRSAGA